MTIIIIKNNYYFYKIFVFQNFPQEIEVSQLLILMKKFDSREAKNVLWKNSAGEIRALLYFCFYFIHEDIQMLKYIISIISVIS